MKVWVAVSLWDGADILGCFIDKADAKQALEAWAQDGESKWRDNDLGWFNEEGVIEETRGYIVQEEVQKKKTRFWYGVTDLEDQGFVQVRARDAREAKEIVIRSLKELGVNVTPQELKARRQKGKE